MSCNKHHNNYKILYSDALIKIKQLEEEVQRQKFRGDNLQHDLDRYDDFLAVCESETARSLTGKVS